MRAPQVASPTGGSAGVGGAPLIIILVLMLAATVYLWRTRYIRRRTAHIMMGVLIVALIAIGIFMYSAGS